MSMICNSMGRERDLLQDINSFFTSCWNPGIEELWDGTLVCFSSLLGKLLIQLKSRDCAQIICKNADCTTILTPAE